MQTMNFTARRVGATALLIAACLAGAAAPAKAANVWDSSVSGGLSCGSSGCHTLPPTVANSVPDGVAATYGIGLGESWMSSATALQTRANNATFRSGSMGALTGPNADSVWNYFKQVRDGVMSTPSATPAFPNAVAGFSSSSSNSFSFTVTNYRNAALNYSVGLTGTNSSEFAVFSQSVAGAGCTSSQLPAATTTSGVACTFTMTLRFQPTGTSGGSRSANLKVTLAGLSGSDAAPVDSADKSIALSATADSQTPGFSIVGPSPLSSQVGTAVTQEVQIFNPSTATGPLTIGSLTAANPFADVTAGAAGDYSFVVSSSPACAIDGSTTLVGINSGCFLKIRFLPSVKGARNVTMTIPHNASGNPAVVSVTGTGQQATINLGGVTTVALGNANVGSSSQQTLALTNNGTAPFTFTGLPVSGTGASEFSVSNGCTNPLNVSATACNLTITFTPTGTTPRTVTLAINGNSSNAAAVTLTGTGFALPTLSSVTAFPSTPVGTTSATTRVLTITNPRANAITYSTGGFSGTNGSDFTIASGGESCSNHVVAGGSSCTITLQFTPATGPGAGGRVGSLGLSFSAASGEPTPPAQSAALSGTAVLAPAILVSPTTINFSAVVGTPTTSTATITNTGSAALTLNTLTFGVGSFDTEYTLAAGNTCTTGLSIPATPGSNTCTLAIQFNPANASPSTRDAALSIAHNATGSPQALNLHGTATPAPQPSIDLGGVTSLAFGAVPLGSSGQQTITVLNNGQAALNFSGLSISGANAAEFARSGTCAVGTAVPRQTSCTLVVTFTPAAVGSRAAGLDISSDASNSVPTIGLGGSGQALAEPVLSPLPLSAFPSALVGSTSSTTRVLTIANPRPNSITYTRPIGGTNPGDFTVSAESCASHVVPGGGSCTVTLQYTPTAAGARSAALNLSFTGFAADPAPLAQSVALAGTAALPAPAFSINSTSLVFAAVVGTPTTTSALITNTGTAGLTLSSLAFGGVSASEFTLDATNTCAANTTFAPSSGCTLVIRYAPVAAGGSTATLSITHSAAGSPQVVALGGTATPAPQGKIALSALSLAFTDTQLGSPSTQPSITVQNTGDLALTFSAFATAGAAAADFTRGGTCSTAAALAIGAQCSLSITFQPTALGARNASLTIQSDASNGAATLAFTGTGIPVPVPVVSLSVATLDFGAQTVGGIYPKRSVTLTNTGTASLTTIAVTVQGAAFTDASTIACPATLAVGANCVIDAAFAPTAAGTSYSASVQIASNATGAPHSVALTGSGTAALVPVLVWSPAVARFDFGQVSPGTVSATQSATLLNQGPGGARMTLLNALGVDGASFSITSTTCAVGQTLFEGQTCSIDVRFAPASAGSKSAVVQIASTGSFPTELVLAGTGLGGPSPDLALSTRALNFSGTRIDARSLPAEITLSGSGAGVVRITAMAIKPPYVLQTKTCPAMPFTLAAGSECTVTVSFAPQAEGAAAGTLSITTDASPAVREVALSGQGEKAADTSGGGGCSIGRGDAATDPTLWTLLLLAAAALARRAQFRRQQRRAAALAGHEHGHGHGHEHGHGQS